MCSLQRGFVIARFFSYTLLFKDEETIIVRTTSSICPIASDRVLTVSANRKQENQLQATILNKIAPGVAF